VVRELAYYFGATAVGIKAKDGVVLAADKRMSYNGFIMSRNVRKVFVINERIAIAVTGFYADISGLQRMLEAEIRYYEVENNRKLPLRSVAKLLSNILYSYKLMPFYVETVVGGIDADNEPRIYVLDPVGAITEEKFIATGSGATLALGVIESEYRDNIDLEKASELALDAMRTAIGRDAGTGDGIDIVKVKRDGGYEIKTLRFKVTEA